MTPTATQIQLAHGMCSCLVTMHHDGETSLILGDPEDMLGRTATELCKAGFAGDVVGDFESSKAPWTGACGKTSFLYHHGKGHVRWLESWSKMDPTSGAFIVSTQVLTLPAGDELLLLARLCFGGGLLGPMAHEINNHVQGLSSAAYLFRDCLEHNDPIEMEDVDQLAQAVTSLKTLGAELQYFARSTTEPAELVSVPKLVARSVRFLESTGKLKTTSVSVSIPDDLPDMLWPQLELEFLILALLGNAADAALDNSEQQAVDITVTTDSTSMKIAIHDSGLSKLHLSRQGEPFVTSKARHRNVGIGMSVAMEIVAHHQGTIEVADEKAGKLIRVSLPLEATLL